MADIRPPGEYDSEEGYDDSNGCERCPACQSVFSLNGGLTGPVFDKRGREYDVYLDSPPGAMLFCEDCWPQVEAAGNASENHSLREFDTIATTRTGPGAGDVIGGDGDGR